MNEELKLPFYAKATIFLIGLVALFSVLYIARGIIIPLVFATILAVLLHPVVNFFVRIRINRILAIAITLIITFLFLAGFSALLISQVSRFSDFWPVLVDKFTLIINQTISDGADYFHRDPQKIHEWIAKTQGEILNSSAAAIGYTLKMIGGGLVVVLLLPVYIFLILFYQPLLIEFIHRLFGKDNHNQVSEIVSKIKTVIQRYLAGLVIEAAIVAALDTSALLILGIDYALLLGITGALLNVIPYIGGLVAVSLPMLVAIATKSSPLYAFYVMAAYYFIQLIDNNYIVPYIVASKVKINALFSIIAVLAGNALWGIPGMFLAIPLLAVIKLVFDHIEPLKAWGFLLGDTMPSLIAIKTIFKKVKSK
jgi:predicted PurR-regulated permease PerM